MVLADPAGSVLADYVKTGRIGQAGSWVVEGIGEDFVPPIADLSRVRERLHDRRRRKPRHRPQPAEKRRHSGRLVDRNPRGGRLAVLPRPVESQARRHAGLRLGQQVSLEDVQRLLDGRSGFSDGQIVRRLARFDQPPICRGGGRQRGARRSAERRLHAHAAARRFAIARARRARKSSAFSTSPTCCWPPWPMRAFSTSRSRRL